MTSDVQLGLTNGEPWERLKALRRGMLRSLPHPRSLLMGQLWPRLPPSWPLHAALSGCWLTTLSCSFRPSRGPSTLSCSPQETHGYCFP